MEGLRPQLARLVDGYPVDLSELHDGLRDRDDCVVFDDLLSGPALALVQFGMWEEEEHHPGPLYLDLDPRRLRAGRLDVVYGRMHWGPVGQLHRTLAAWSTSGGSSAHAASLERAWQSGHRSPAVASRLATYASLDAFSSPKARAYLDAGIAADPLSLALRLDHAVRFRGPRDDPATASQLLPMLACHAWSRTADAETTLISKLGVAAAFHPAVFGDLAELAADFSRERRRSAVDTVGDRELAMRLAVDWAYEGGRTDLELDGLLRPLAAQSSEPVWSRLCAFRG